MTRDLQLDDSHHNDEDGMIPHTDGAGDKKKAKRGIAKEKVARRGSGAGRPTPTTPRRKDRDGGHESANITTYSQTSPRSTRVRGSYIIEPGSRHVTDVSDIYLGPPGAAFTTLRRPESAQFRALLRRLRETSQHAATQSYSLSSPQLALPHEDCKAVDQHRTSPADSAIDVLTPELGVGSISIEIDTKDATPQVETMAPVQEISQAERNRVRERDRQVEIVSDSLKDVIQNYYEVQAQVQGYISETETRDVLVNKIQELSQSLAHLARESSDNTITNTFVPPEVVDYVDDGRNPDIYKRELVEVVQRGNAVLNGKMNAFGSFSKIFADDLRGLSPSMAKAVDDIMSVEDDGGEVVVKQENGGSHRS